MIDIDLRKIGELSKNELRRLMKKENKEELVMKAGVVKLCPFCGSVIEIVKKKEDGLFYAYHMDEGCLFSDPVLIRGHDTYADAVKEWNRQVDEATFMG